MKYKPLGRTGLLVSELCMGTMTFGDPADESESKKMFYKCRDAGVNFFDCADIYNKGVSEEILGVLAKDCRDEIVLTSKATFRSGDGINEIGSSRRHLMLSVEKSLERLQTDRLDFYFIHTFDPYTDIELVLRTLDDLVQQGKILYPGVSNWAAWQIAKALGISAREHLSRFECIQPMYNLVKRQAEVELLPLALSEKLGVIPYSPIAAGLLSGKYNQNKKPDKGRIVQNSLYIRRYSKPEYFDIAREFCVYADRKGIHPVTLAIGWVKAHPVVTAPIIGARCADQLMAALDAADLDVIPEMYEEISALSITPDPATDRLEEILDENTLLRPKGKPVFL